MNVEFKKLALALSAFTILFSYPSIAAISSADIVAAGKAKKNLYFSNATLWGGDSLANPVVLANLRWAPNQGFERIVVDLAGEGPGWEAKTPPYFQVGVDGKENKILINIRGVSKRQVSTEKISRSISRSSLIKSGYLAPGLEGDLASIELQSAKAVEVESFYLVSPPRIILDVKEKH